MPLSQLLVFAAAHAAVLLLPGPGVTAIVARVLARGLRGMPFFIAGFWAGSLTWFTLAATGLAVLASTFATLFVVIRYAGAAYLIYLAWKFWRAAPRPVGTADASPEGGLRLFLTGLAINLGNPKAIVFFLALLPSVVDLDRLTSLGFAELAAIVTVNSCIILTGYALLAARARRLFTSPRAVRTMNRSSALVMAGTAIGIAAR